ncbi:MAG TPA: hypothetical protein VK338_02005 [Candidatus Nitrosocosmicus sp.]|nr:hypothetical protein [Candidatus Nitrosocosmicus sp.]
MKTLIELEQEIEQLKERNNLVEANKAWETSIFRKIIIAIFTYSAIALYMKFVLNIDPWVNAIVPTLGFLLSTLTMSFFKKIWLKYIYKD